MRPVILSLDELSDSKEVYEAKPKIVFSLFIYIVLCIILITLGWMYFGRIDVVVKSESILRPNDQVATIVNNYAGTIETVYIEDGQRVNEGDILYIIEHQVLIQQKDYYSKQLKDTNKEIQNLQTYKKSIEDDNNYFNKEEEEYYLKYRSFYINYSLSEKDTYYKNQTRNLNKESITEQVKEQRNRLSNLKKLEESINSGKNLLSSQTKEKDLYLKYQSDYTTLVQKYDSAESEIRLSTTEEGMINSLDYYTDRKKGLNLLKQSIEKGINLFTDNNSYSLQYQEYQNKLADLKAAYDQAKEEYDINKALEGLAVTTWETEQSEKKTEDAKRAVETFKTSYIKDIKSSITEIEKSIKELKLSKQSTLSKDELLSKSEDEKNNALANFKLGYLLDLHNNITELEDNIKSLENNLSSISIEEDKVFLTGVEKKTDAALEEYKNSEIRSTIDSINTCKDKKEELTQALEKLNRQIEEATVIATKDGVINSNTELVKGDTLNAGTIVMTIIPDNASSFKANIYTSNKDIGKLNVGMQVKFNVYALPNSEYGYLMGKITKISKDLKVDEKNAGGYYLVEASIEGKKLFDSKGKEVALKAGMSCQAQMITENKRIIKFVLEKMNFLKE